jgi:hypothetical protein
MKWQIMVRSIRRKGRLEAMSFTRTHTRTHVYVSYANPYLRCMECGDWVSGWHDPEKCGCETLLVNTPCCCRLGVKGACPTWSPVDGCTCLPGMHDQPPERPPTVDSSEVPIRVGDCIPDVLLDLTLRVRRGSW